MPKLPKSPKLSALRRLSISSCLALFLGLFSSPALAQVEDHHSYIIASPNTRAALSDDDARKSLDSFEEENAVAIADRIGCALTRTVRIGEAIGLYDNSAENSLVMQADLKAEQLQYAAALLGRYAHQEYVLLFTPKDDAPDQLWRLTTHQSFDVVAKATRELHLAPLTLRIEPDHVELWIVDKGGEHNLTIQTLVRQLRASGTVETGTMELAGNDDRAKASTFFQEKIDRLEKTSHLHLSRQLWSESWHDATTRTCSENQPLAISH